ncbi:MAG: SirB2 family protein [Pseudomonadales bacterium]|nr:SirB2 family protein [Pseudomonadales bacterium]
MYLTFKLIHMTCAMLSITGFLFRAFLMFMDSPLLKHKVVLIVPHLIDSVFLLSGLSMALMVNFMLFEQAWLMTKIGLLMLYLLFVGIALNRGATKKTRVQSFFLALFTFAYIIGVALTKHSAGWFSLL